MIKTDDFKYSEVLKAMRSDVKFKILGSDLRAVSDEPVPEK